MAILIISEPPTFYACRKTDDHQTGGYGIYHTDGSTTKGITLNGLAMEMSMVDRSPTQTNVPVEWKMFLPDTVS